jgi:hypothetical protein
MKRPAAPKDGPADFHYTDEQWRAIGYELDRAGVAADTATVGLSHFGSSGEVFEAHGAAPASLRWALERFATRYLDMLAARKRRVDQARTARSLCSHIRATCKLLDGLKQAECDSVRPLKEVVARFSEVAARLNTPGGIGWVLKRSEEEIGRYEDLIRRLETVETQHNHRAENELRLARRGNKSAADYFLGSVSRILVSLGDFAIGNERGPSVGFLYAAAKPVLGRDAPSKAAIRTWLRRAKAREIQLKLMYRGALEVPL